MDNNTAGPQLRSNTVSAAVPARLLLYLPACCCVCPPFPRVCRHTPLTHSLLVAGQGGEECPPGNGVLPGLPCAGTGDRQGTTGECEPHLESAGSAPFVLRLVFQTSPQTTCLHCSGKQQAVVYGTAAAMAYGRCVGPCGGLSGPGSTLLGGLHAAAQTPAHLIDANKLTAPACIRLPACLLACLPACLSVCLLACPTLLPPPFILCACRRTWLTTWPTPHTTTPSQTLPCPTWRRSACKTPTDEAGSGAPLPAGAPLQPLLRWAGNARVCGLL